MKTTGANNSPVDENELDARREAYWKHYETCRDAVLATFDTQRWNHIDHVEEILNGLAAVNDVESTIVTDFLWHVIGQDLGRYKTASIAGVAAAWAYSKGRQELLGLRPPGPVMP